MPDTYRIERGMTRQQLVNRMGAAQREALNAVWAKRSPEVPIKTPQELVILASIVEKETGKGDERPRVAGVFHNRLAKRMKLQSDPTIVYGLVGGKGTLGRGIAKDEITRATPYNTYVVEGLPPGPIANPGRAALEAVANPARTKDLYFVADGTGGHAFAETTSSTCATSPGGVRSSGSRERGARGAGRGPCGAAPAGRKAGDGVSRLFGNVPSGSPLPFRPGPGGGTAGARAAVRRLGRHPPRPFSQTAPSTQLAEDRPDLATALSGSSALVAGRGAPYGPRRSGRA
jgi:hypothetical protein